MSTVKFDNNFGYNMGNLRPEIYLFKRDNMKVNKLPVYDGDISFTGGYKIEGSQVTFRETQSYDERFSFSSELVIQINEAHANPYFNELYDLLHDTDTYIGMFRTNNGEWFITSAEFEGLISYEYNFTSEDESSDVLSITLSTLCNNKALIIQNAPAGYTILFSRYCDYGMSKVSKLQLANFNNVVIDKGMKNQFDKIIFSDEDGITTIPFIEGTLTYTETYSRMVYNKELVFSLPLKNASKALHYKLTEFPLNTYVVILNTTQSNTIIGGIENGFIVKYQIETSEDDTTGNVITFTLNCQGAQPSLYNTSDSPWEQNRNVVLVPVEEYRVCGGDGYALRTVFQEQTLVGEWLNRYHVLEGYNYPELNVVGTYEENDIINGVPVKVDDESCVYPTCVISVNHSNAKFSFSGDKKQINIYSTCDWTLQNLPDWLEVDVTEGKAQTTTTITLTSKLTATGENNKDDNIIINTYNNAQLINVILVENKWLSPLNINIDARRQGVSSYFTSVTGTNVELVSKENVESVTIENNSVFMMMSPNYSITDQVIGTVVLKNGLINNEQTITITQDKLYEEWRQLSTDYTICVGNDLYEKLIRYIGYRPDLINEKTEEYKTGNLIQANAAQCVNQLREWRKICDPDGNNCQTRCELDTLYYYEQLYISNDSGVTWVAQNSYRLGDVIETNSPECNSNYSWKYFGKTTCSGGNLYKQLEKYYFNGVEDVPMNEYKLGDLLETNSVECVDPSQNSITWTFDADFTGNAFLEVRARANGRFQVNWGDGSYENIDVDDDTSYKTFNHFYTPNTNVTATITVTGPVTGLRLYKPTEINVTDFHYSAINLKYGQLVRDFEMRCYRISNIDLSDNNNLVNFTLRNNLDSNSTLAIQWPEGTSYLQNVWIGGYSDDEDSITESALQSMLNNLPKSNVGAGIVNLCYNNNACNLDVTTALQNNWYLDSSTCCDDKSKWYKLEESNVELCNNNTHDKYNSYEILKYNEATNQYESMTPPVYVFRSIIEKDSEDCGFENPYQYKWEVVQGQYMCKGTTKMTMEQQFQSSDKGVTWVPVVPNKFRIGSTVIESNSQDCGYTPPPPIYEWRDSDAFVCDVCDVCDGGESPTDKLLGYIVNTETISIPTDITGYDVQQGKFSIAWMKGNYIYVLGYYTSGSSYSDKIFIYNHVTGVSSNMSIKLWEKITSQFPAAAIDIISYAIDTQSDVIYMNIGLDYSLSDERVMVKYGITDEDITFITYSTGENFTYLPDTNSGSMFVNGRFYMLNYTKQSIATTYPNLCYYNEQNNNVQCGSIRQYLTDVSFVSQYAYGTKIYVLYASKRLLAINLSDYITTYTLIDIDSTGAYILPLLNDESYVYLANCNNSTWKLNRLNRYTLDGKNSFGYYEAGTMCDINVNTTPYFSAFAGDKLITYTSEKDKVYNRYNYVLKISKISSYNA